MAGRRREATCEDLLYSAERPPDVEVVMLPGGLRGGWRRVAPNVWALGVTSLLTDVSSEMVTSILPLYVLVHLGLSPFAYGFVDGLQHGITAVLRIASGVLSDRSSRHKEVAASGYAASALARLGLALAGGSLTGVASWLAIDRLGKGVRSAPRDALISLSSPRSGLGAAFGVHRSLDAFGAALGPFIAFVVLASVPDGFSTVFAWSFLISLAGVAAIVLLVSNTPAGANGEPPSPSPRLLEIAREPRLRRLLAATAALSLTTIGDPFLYLALQRRAALVASDFPLLFVATSLCYFALAAPFGRLADRFGRRRVFLLGAACLLPAYATPLVPGPDALAVGVCVVLLGVFYAATDGVLAALAASLLSGSSRARGLALVSTTTSLSRLAASLGFGALWTAAGFEAAVGVFAAGLAGALFASWRFLLPQEASH